MSDNFFHFEYAHYVPPEKPCAECGHGPEEHPLHIFGYGFCAKWVPKEPQQE